MEIMNYFKLLSFIASSSLLTINTTTADTLDQDFEIEEIMFVTPTKSALSPHDTPNSVTKLYSEDLLALGIDSVPDALRLVPGMMVSDLHGSNTQAGYHGLAVSVPRRMDVLYNSSSIYRPGYAGIHWRRLPFWVQDIESIEVLRGSASSDFGSNAFTGAVNLIQKPIALEDAVFGSFRVDSNDVEKVRGGFHIGNESNHLYGRVFREESSGYDFAERSPEYKDDYDGTGVLFSGEHEIASNTVFDWNIAYSDYTFTAPSLGFVGNTELMGEGDVAEGTQDSVAEIRPSDESNLHAIAKLSGAFKDSSYNVFLKYSEFERDQTILFCNIAGSFNPLFGELDASPNVHINPVDFPLILQSGLSTGVVQLDASIVNPLNDNDTRILTELGQELRRFGPDTILEVICGDADIGTSEQRSSFGGSFTNKLADNLQLSSSLEYIYSKADSQNYLKGVASRNTLQFSNNLLWRPHSSVSINFGLMAEGDDYLDKFVFSPRANLNYSFNNNISFKTTYSLSKRTPDIHETDRKWQIHVDYLGDNIDFLGQSEADVFRVARSPESLESEEIESYELGLVFTSDNRKHILDSKVFQENMSNLISEPLLYLDFNLTNNGEIDKRGFETSYAGETDSIKYGLAYTYLDWDTETEFETTLLSRHIGNAWGIVNLPWSSKLGVSFSGHNGGKNRSYRLYTLNYSKYFEVGSASAEFQVGVKRYPEYTYTLTEFSSEDPAAIGFDNQNQYYMTFSITY